ncbi:MAG: YceI family protein [Saprospiraceae bacterium]|nr:YceI family protein [Saprospiraceae bacterium]
MFRLITLLLLLMPSLAQAQTFSIDGGHSAVVASVYTSQERFGMEDVVGRFDEVRGTVKYSDDLSLMACTLAIRVDSYRTDNPSVRAAVISPAFLNAGMYPELRFESTGVTRENERLIASGKLTVHGHTRPVSFPITVVPQFKAPNGTNTIAISAELTINRQDFGVSFDRRTPDDQPLVANEVRISVDLLAVQE